MSCAATHNLFANFKKKTLEPKMIFQPKTFLDYRHDFAFKIFQKLFFIKNCSKISKNHLQELKNLRKTIFCKILIVLDQNDILKKKVPKFAQNCRNFCNF